MGLTQLLENDKQVRGGFSLPPSLGTLSRTTIVNPQDLLKYIARRTEAKLPLDMPQRMAEEAIDGIINTTVDKVKRLVKRTKPEKKQLGKGKKLKGGINKTDAKSGLLAKGYDEDEIDEYLATHVIKPTYTLDVVEKQFKKWKSKRPRKPSADDPKKGKEEEEKESPPKPAPPPMVISADDPAIPPGPPAARRLPPGTFRLSEKEFDNIKNTNPKIEYRRILKSFFSELSITNFGGLPGDFVKSINELGLRSGSREETLDKLRSTLSSYRTNLSKREPSKETTVKLRVAEATKKKKAPKKPVIHAKKGTVRKLPKPSPKPKKAKKTKVVKKITVRKVRVPKGKGDESPINVLI